MPNQALSRALQSLAHPVSLAMIVVLIVNDHILKHTMKSWWTGKLSDVAGLAFAPLLVAVFIALLIPTNHPRQKSLVFWLAIAFVGVTFTLIKTVPDFNQFTLDILYNLTGNRHSIILDPTDILALPALFVAYWIWHKSIDFKPSRSMMLVGLTLASVGTMATADDDGPWYYGATCVKSFQNSVQVSIYDKAYYSQDGGLTWQISDTTAPQCDQLHNFTSHETQNWFEDSHQWQYTAPNNPQLVFEFRSNSIQKSNDGGETWQTEYQLEDIRKKRRKEDGWGSLIARFGAQSAVIDPQTGNLIVAMGYHGILVREPDGNWQWVGVDIYDFNKMATRDELIIDYHEKHLQTRLWGIALEVFITSMLFVGQSKSIFHPKNIIYNLIVMPILLLNIYLVTYKSDWLYLAECVLGINIVFVVMVSVIVLQFQRLSYLLRTYVYNAIWAIPAVVTFILPYYLWYSGILSNLSVSSLLASIFSILTMLVVRDIVQSHPEKPTESLNYE